MRRPPRLPWLPGSVRIVRSVVAFRSANAASLGSFRGAKVASFRNFRGAKGDDQTLIDRTLLGFGIRGGWQFLWVAILFSVFASPVCSSPVWAQAEVASITDRSMEWPDSSQWRRVLLLEDYNTRVVVLGVALLGAACGIVGSFTLLRKRALMGDALAHASLPGIAAAFMLATLIGADEKSLAWLLSGATLSGLMGVGLILFLRHQTRLKEDTALGIVLSVFFGAGMAMLGVIQQMEKGHAAGLETFIYGKTASMRAADAGLIAVASLLAIGSCVLLFKELKLLCFDADFAGSRGMPVLWLDWVLMALVVLTTIVGLQAVGLILVVALLVIPAAAARFWTEAMWRMAWIAAGLGMLGGVFGAASSALFPKLPSGAMIVLVCAVLFLFSMVFGAKRGMLIRSLRRRRLNRRVGRQHLLRGIYELAEDKSSRQSGSDRPAVSMRELQQLRSWSKKSLQATIRRAMRDELVQLRADQVQLTHAGWAEAARLTRQHRLWELYLVHYAEVAPARVDRDADAIEHVLEPELVDELEALLDQQPLTIEVPSNPHALTESS